jgi:hypothetical protein
MQPNTYKTGIQRYVKILEKIHVGSETRIRIRSWIRNHLKSRMRIRKNYTGSRRQSSPVDELDVCEGKVSDFAVELSLPQPVDRHLCHLHDVPHLRNGTL